MTKIKISADGLTLRRLEELTPSEIETFFDQGRQWDLAPNLSKGGSLIFPHTTINSCGDHIAAAVTGCLDAGAPRVIAIGVIHSMGREPLLEARRKSFAGQDISKEPYWGIFGPLFLQHGIWEAEYSLQNFVFFWDYEVRRRCLKNPPELILAYPCLANREPWKLPGIELLKSYLPHSIVVATIDFCHHGRAYSTPEDQIRLLSKEAEQAVVPIIQEGLDLMEKQDYSEYLNFCQRTITDGVDVGQLLMHLRPSLQSKILDTRLVDTAHLYEGDPSPSWVATSLIEMIPG